ncbi:FecR domain-containing protein [Neptuniibacter sp. QD48_55]|uniref:FecR family protein n=1 Tax=Neptuniibacter sp. QD48_55 TaxID=3398212 RepID=UPI0039F5E332
MSLLSNFSRILFLLFCFISNPVAANNEIGKVVLIQGKPLVERQNQHLFIKRNDPLFIEDVLITPVGSKILIKLADKTTISLAENTQFELSKYQFDKKAQTSDVSFKMLKGAFRTLTGSIGKQKQPKFEIHTPVATIGVRGTEFWGGMIFSDSLDVTMLEGKGVYIKNEHGQVEITRPGDGTMVSKGMKPSEVSMWSDEKLQKAAAATELKQQRQNQSDDYLNY